MAPMIGPTRAELIERLTSLFRAPKLPITLAVYEPRAVVKREGERWVIRALVRDTEAERRAAEAATAAGASYMPEHTWRTLVEGDLLLDAPSRRALAEGVKTLDGRGIFPEEG